MVIKFWQILQQDNNNFMNSTDKDSAKTNTYTEKVFFYDIRNICV